MKKQKEIKTDLVKVKWNMSRFVILAVLAVVNFFINKYISSNPSLPFWLNGFGPIMAAAVDGPLFGAYTAAAWLALDIIFSGWSTYTFLLAVMMGAMAGAFGVMLRLGLIGNKKSLPWAIMIIVLVDTMLGISTSMAAYGSATYTNSVTNFISEVMVAGGFGDTFSSVTAYVAASIFDKCIIIAAVLLVLRLMPQSVADLLSIEKQIPAAVFEDDEDDGPKTSPGEEKAVTKG